MKSKQKKLLIFLLAFVTIFSMVPSGQLFAASQIRITEIMYDPLGNGDKEFVEIYNGSNYTADLSGWSFSNGINFTFPNGSSLSAGKYGVLVRDRNTFRASYPNANIFGQYVGKLVGRGELVKLVDKSGGAVSQVDYRSGGGWPTAPRNGGPSLSLIRSTADESQAGCWGSSTAPGGSPGFANSASGGGGCANKAYAEAPVQGGSTGSGSANQSGGGAKPSGGGSKNPTGGSNTQPQNPNDTSDQSLANLTEAEKEELKKQDTQETQEDLQESLNSGDQGAMQNNSDPKAKIIAGLIIGILIIGMGVGYFGLEKIAHSENKSLSKFKKFIKHNKILNKLLRLR